jgi:ABC-type uncharacterized transport system permease subunit
LARLPAWVEYGLLPLLNLAAALVVAGIVVLIIGESPAKALAALVAGAVGDPEAIAFTLHYATSFVFAGLAVALPFHAGLFNIGGEGQAYFAGLGVALVCLGLPPGVGGLAIPVAIVAAMAFGAAWAFIPALLQAWRGSHLVITTILFNFIASGAMAWILVDVLRSPQFAAPESAAFPNSTWLPRLADVAPGIGGAPLNVAFLLAIVVSLACWVLLWRTRWGYEIRAFGFNPAAALYAGIPVARTTVVAVCLGGALAGLLAVNELMGAQHRLVLNFTGGAGFVGIAVALMGRNHPVGIFLAALLFGVLAQGGAELAFDMPAIRREMILVLEGVVVVFCGALEHLFRAPLERLFAPAPAPA